MAIDRETHGLVLMLKSMITWLPEEDQKKVKDDIEFIDKWMNEPTDDDAKKFRIVAVTLALAKVQDS
jgi:hypothetical protein